MLDYLVRLGAPHFRIIVVSRFQPIIKHNIKEDIGWSSMNRTVENIQADIDLFALQHISQHNALADQNDKVKDSIRCRFGQGRKGMWVLPTL